MIDLSPEDSDLSLRARSLLKDGGGSIVRLLTPIQRRRLKSIGTRMVVTPRTIMCREDTACTDTYICISGAAKAFRVLRSGARRISTFLFADDIFGLAEEGRYVNTVQAISPSIVLRLPVEPLTRLLMSDPDLEFQFLCKITHELRESQRRAIILTRHDAVGRVAMFATMLEANIPKAERRGVLPLPMSRTDIADYLGLSPEAVSRATRRLIQHGILAFDGRNTARVLDRKRLEELAAAH